jgi:predicted DNA-binding transcriptional regulator YafY
VPVFAERGRNGGFELLKGYRTDLTGLDSQEADAVALMGMAQAAEHLGFADSAAAARRKVLASVPARANSLAHRIASRFHLDSTPWYSRATPPPLLRELARAVWSDRQVKVTYESWKDVVKRTLSPLGLVMKAGTWYFAAAGEREPRIYRVSAIRKLTLTDTPAKRPREFDLARFWNEAARNFEQQLRSETARVRLSPKGAALLRDWNPAAADALDAQAPVPAADGWVEADIPVEKVPHAVREVLRIGAEIEVVGPAEFRAAVAAEAEKLARMHRGAGRRARQRTT